MKNTLKNNRNHTLKHPLKLEFFFFQNLIFFNNEIKGFFPHKLSHYKTDIKSNLKLSYFAYRITNLIQLHNINVGIA